jgi:polyphosphate glucokinase
MKKKSPKSSAKSVSEIIAGPFTLALDIGGTGIKALTLDPAGRPINDRTRIKTPKHATPNDVLDIARELAKVQPGYDRVSVGFPGVVKDGVIYTAANLGRGWEGFDLGHALERKLKFPVRIANDADIQGLGCVSGRGLELVITLGTGFGSVLFADGTRVHLELGHHPFHDGKTYEDELGDRALKKKGRKKWIKLLKEAIDELQRTFNYDALFIGGGNSRLVNFELPPTVRTISNEDGLLGGIALWRDEEKELPKMQKSSAKAAAPSVKAMGKAVEKPSKAVAKPPAPAGAKSAAAKTVSGAKPAGSKAAPSTGAAASSANISSAPGASTANGPAKSTETS